MQIERTYDYEHVRYIADKFPEFKKTIQLNKPNVIVLHAYDIGLFLGPIRGLQASMHACVLPEQRGTKAVQAGKLAMQWFRDNTQLRRIVCRCLKEKKTSQIFSVMCGLKRCAEDNEYIYYEAIL